MPATVGVQSYLLLCLYVCNIHELSTLAALHAAKGLRDGQQPCLFSTAPTSEPCTLSDSAQAELHRPKSASTHPSHKSCCSYADHLSL
jgi:hypothetical protein